MEITSITFVAFVAAGLVAFWLIDSPLYKHCVLLVLNAIFLLSYITTWTQILPYLVFLVLGYGAIEAVRRARRGSFTAIAVVTILVLFIYLKKYIFIPSDLFLGFPYLVIGLSYIFFRVLQLVIDAHYGELPARIGVMAYLNFTCNFLTLISGPIQEYSRFREYYDTPVISPDRDTVARAFARIVQGYLWVLALSGVAYAGFASLRDMALAPDQPSLTTYSLTYAAAAGVYILHLYFNFAGYMHIIIGFGALFGLTLPENFDRPLAARSFLDLWTRWHMTLSNWFKLYLFNPLLKSLAERFPSPAATQWLAVVAFFVTFTVMGIWHGSTAAFLVYGLVLGAGSSGNKLWQIWMGKRLGRKRYRALCEHPAYALASHGATFAYFAIAVTCLWVDIGQMQQIAGRLGILGGLLAFLALGAACAVVAVAADALGALRRAGAGWGKAGGGTGALRDAWLAGQVVVTLLVLGMLTKTPDFVYKAF